MNRIIHKVLAHEQENTSNYGSHTGIKQLYFGFLLKEGGETVKPEYKAFKKLLEDPFFSLSLDIFKERGGKKNPNLMKNPFS